LKIHTRPLYDYEKPLRTVVSQQLKFLDEMQIILVLGACFNNHPADAEVQSTGLASQISTPPWLSISLGVFAWFLWW